MANHSLLTGADLHEPKGVATATLSQVYFADGAGSGVMKVPIACIGGFVTFDAATPAYQHTTTTSDTVIDPTFSVTNASLFSASASPNARLIYTGTEDRHAFLRFNVSSKQASGSDKDIELVLYQNGVALEGSRVVRTASTGAWGSVVMGYDANISTNDYFEVFTKADANATVDYASMYLFIQASIV